MRHSLIMHVIHFHQDLHDAASTRTLYALLMSICFCNFSKLVHKALYILHSLDKSLTADGVVSMYAEYLHWYERTPVVLRLGYNSTPAVLLL